MNWKSRLLGTVAAVIVTGEAAAADAVVVADSEPIQYVAVCDVFGKGFFYIPGTETCLRISGYVRHKVGATNDDGFRSKDGQLVGDTPNYQGYQAGGWNNQTRARINFDARTETEWGTMRAFVRLQSSWGKASQKVDPFKDGPAVADQAWLSLGGLRVGYTQSAWQSTVFGVTNGGSFSDGQLYFGGQQRHLIQYDFGSKKGLFGVVSLEDDALAGRGYVPDVVGVVGYGGGWGAIWTRLGYDESYNEARDGGFGAQLGAELEIPDTDSAIRVMGWYADADHKYGTQSAYKEVTKGNGNAEWSFLASYNHQFSKTFSASTGFQYFNNFYAKHSDVKTGVNGYGIDLSFVYEPVEDFEIRTEGNYDKVDGLDGSVSGFVWFLRRF